MDEYRMKNGKLQKRVFAKQVKQKNGVIIRAKKGKYLKFWVPVERAS